jgi:hypothetical protein
MSFVFFFLRMIQMHVQYALQVEFAVPVKASG